MINNSNSNLEAKSQVSRSFAAVCVEKFGDTVGEEQSMHRKYVRSKFLEFAVRCAC